MSTFAEVTGRLATGLGSNRGPMPEIIRIRFRQVPAIRRWDHRTRKKHAMATRTPIPATNRASAVGLAAQKNAMTPASERASTAMDRNTKRPTAFGYRARCRVEFTR